jgi:hypothetical protein
MIKTYAIGTGIYYMQCCGSGSGIRDPVPFYPKDPESGSGIRDDFFSGSRIPDLGSRIPDSYHVPNSRYLLKMAKNRKN